MTACKRCGATGVPLFGYQGLCAEHYAAYMDHQKDLREETLRNREMLAARIVHPAGRSARYRARDWIQKRDPETGRSTA